MSKCGCSYKIEFDLYNKCKEAKEKYEKLNNLTRIRDRFEQEYEDKMGQMEFLLKLQELKPDYTNREGTMNFGLSTKRKCNCKQIKQIKKTLKNIVNKDEYMLGCNRIYKKYGIDDFTDESSINEVITSIDEDINIVKNDIDMFRNYIREMDEYI